MAGKRRTAKLGGGTDRMKKPFLQKNILRDMLERDYPVYVSSLFILLLWEAVTFLVSKANANPVLTYPVRLFSCTTVGMIFAVAGPFVIVWRLLSQYNSSEAGDVFYSLPTTRRSIYGSATAIAFGYLAGFLITETLMMKIIFGCSKYISIESGYFATKIVLISAMFLFCYGLAMICFSLSSGGLWYSIIYASWVFLLFCLYTYIGGLPIWRYLVHSGKCDTSFAANEITGKWYAKFMTITERVRAVASEPQDMVSEFKQTGDFFWETVPVFLLVGVVVLLLSYFAFLSRRAESVEGKSKSRLMHILLQGAVTLVYTLQTVQPGEIGGWYNWDFFYDGKIGIAHFSGANPLSGNLFGKLFPNYMIAYISTILAVLIIWEILYQKSIYRFYKAWAGMLLGIALIGLAQLIVFL